MNVSPYLIIGLIANSALYLGSVFVAALVDHNIIATHLAIAAMGVTYLSYFVQTVTPSRVGAIGSVGMSVALGAAAGIALLV